ncbi:hypothetical protein GCM10022393_18570 [Aquimarina addita]|uniref:YbjN domain-containing protein n=2 Tax=Aquimarina addita TaxID=870485 RepID=A0ABP6UK74_9FLAO
MDTAKISEIINKHSDTLTGTLGNWQFIYKEVPMICITDATNNRMRIIAPIREASNLNKELLLDAMTANFHAVLDVKYAISNGILWSAYIHPLKELTSEQIESALSQVYFATKNFGTTFSSTELIFGNTNEKKNPVYQENKKMNDRTF